MDQVIDFFNDLIWSDFLVAFLLFLGVYFSFRTRFLQVRLLKTMVKLLFGGRESKEGVSSFQAFALALSGRVGTGNIAGVATAIAWGGPGAVFWMWVIAFIGASTAFVESTLGQMYKEIKDGVYRGGPAYYIKKGIKSPKYATVFAVTITIACGIFTPGIQSNSIAAGMFTAFGIEPLFTGILLVILLAFVIFGGVHRISRTAEIIVPFMAGGYILLAIVIIGMNIAEVPSMIKLIMNSAFGRDATFGGIMGAALSWGVRRGMFSNEAGQGTAPQAAAAAEVDHPVEQGLVQAFSVYIDTILVCTATALMILFSGMYNVDDGTGSFLVEHVPGVDAGTGFTQHAISSYFPLIGDSFVAIALFMFAFTTVMALYYIAETNLSFLVKKKNKYLLFTLRIFVLAGVLYGATKNAKFAWKLGDIGVGLITWLNLTALFILRKPVMKALKDYEVQKKNGKTPVFRPKKLGIENADFWEKKYQREQLKKKEPQSRE